MAFTHCRPANVYSPVSRGDEMMMTLVLSVSAADISSYRPGRSVSPCDTRQRWDTRQTPTDRRTSLPAAARETASPRPDRLATTVPNWHLRCHPISCVYCRHDLNVGVNPIFYSCMSNLRQWHMSEQCFISHQHSIGYTGDGFYRHRSD